MYKGLIALVLLCMLAIPAFASAHTSKVDAVCVDNRISVTFDYKNFNKRVPAVSAESIFLDSTSVYDDNFPFTKEGNNPVTLEGTFYGPHFIEARSVVYQDNKEWSAEFVGNVTCGDKPKEDTPTTTTTTPPNNDTPKDNPRVDPEPKVKKATDCASLKANKAGIKWLKKFGCVKPKPKPITDCSYLFDNGASLKWLEKYHCVVISTRKYNPPVTG